MGLLPHENRVNQNAIAACELTYSNRYYRLEVVVFQTPTKFFPESLAVYRLREGRWVEVPSGQRPGFIVSQEEVMMEWVEQSPRCEALTQEIRKAMVNVPSLPDRASSAVATPDSEVLTPDVMRGKITKLESSLSKAEARLAFVIKHGLPKPWHVHEQPMWYYSHWSGSDPLGASVVEAIDFAIRLEGKADRSAG